MATLGYKLKKLRQAREMSMRALSVHLKKQGAHASYSAIQKWENDETLPSKENLAALCKYFAVEPAWLMFSASSEEENLSSLIDSIKLLSAKNQRLLKRIIQAIENDQEYELAAAGKPRDLGTD